MAKKGARLDTARGGGEKRTSGAPGGARADGRGPRALWRRSRAVRIASVTLGVILLVCVYAVGTWIRYVRLPAQNDPNPVRETPGGQPAAPDMPSEEPASEASSQPPAAAKPTPEQLRLRKNVYTVLLTGTFDDGNTDTIMVATLDTDAKKLDVISIPRDTTTSWDGSFVKINSIYARGGANAEGMEALAQEVSTLVGFRPSNYAMIKMSGFKKLVNTIGGVEFNVPFDMVHLDSDDSKSIRLSKGYRTLNGNEALQLMRFRTSNTGGRSYDDYGRMETQQKFLMAVFKKMVQLDNWDKIVSYVGIAAESIKPTDLDLSHMLAFAAEIIRIPPENIHFHTLPTKTSSGKASYENVIADEALALLNASVNPYDGDIPARYVEWPQYGVDTPAPAKKHLTPHAIIVDMPN